LAEYEPDLNANTVFPSDDQFKELIGSRGNTFAPFKQYSSSELSNAYNASSRVDIMMKTPYSNSEDLLNEAKENHRSIPDNKPFVCSPIRERDSEDPLEQTPTGGNINLNYVTPTATDKNNRRLNIIGNNAPSQNHHESRLSGISPGAKGFNESSMGIQNSIASDVYSKPVGYGVIDQSIKPFKITTPSGVGNQSNSKSSVGSKASKLKDETVDGANLMWLLRRIGAAYVAQIQFLLTKAIELYKKLPENQYKTGWVLTQVGM